MRFFCRTPLAALALLSLVVPSLAHAAHAVGTQSGFAANQGASICTVGLDATGGFVLEKQDPPNESQPRCFEVFHEDETSGAKSFPEIAALAEAPDGSFVVATHRQGDAFLDVVALTLQRGVGY